MASTYIVIYDYDFRGVDVDEPTQQPTPGDCSNKCLQTAGCTGFSYELGEKQEQFCFLRNIPWTVEPNTNRAAGVVAGKNIQVI